VRVADDGAAHGAGRPGPRFEAGEPVQNGPAHEAVQGHAGIRPHQGVRLPHDARRASPHHQSAHARVAHEHVRPAAEHEDLEGVLGGGPHGGDQLVNRHGIEEPVGGPADSEGGQRRERPPLDKSIGAEGRKKCAGFWCGGHAGASVVQRQAGDGTDVPQTDVPQLPACDGASRAVSGR